MPKTSGVPDHDVFSCECHETCSWCTQPVLDRTLREMPDGARICRDCYSDFWLKRVLG